MRTTIFCKKAVLCVVKKGMCAGNLSTLMRFFVGKGEIFMHPVS